MELAKRKFRRLLKETKPSRVLFNVFSSQQWYYLYFQPNRPKITTNVDFLNCAKIKIDNMQLLIGQNMKMENVQKWHVRRSSLNGIEVHVTLNCACYKVARKYAAKVNLLLLAIAASTTCVFLLANSIQNIRPKRKAHSPRLKIKNSNLILIQFSGREFPCRCQAIQGPRCMRSVLHS